MDKTVGALILLGIGVAALYFLSRGQAPGSFTALPATPGGVLTGPAAVPNTDKLIGIGTFADGRKVCTWQGASGPYSGTCPSGY